MSEKRKNPRKQIKGKKERPNKEEKEFAQEDQSASGNNNGNRNRSRSNSSNIYDPKVGHNAVAWYTKYPSLVIGSSSHIFNVPLGNTYKPYGTLNGSSGKTYGLQAAIPGIVTMLWKPWFAAKGTDADALNVASKNLYSYVRHANSGSVNYESSDLMQYILVAASLFTYCEQLKRDLKLLFTYKSTNKYAYKRVLWSMGYTMSDVELMIKNYALYHSRLNTLIAQINTFKIPKEMTFFTRQMWLASHCWKDDMLDKATTYSYVVDGYYMLNWANAQVYRREVIQTLNNTSSFESRLQYLEADVATLLSIEDIGIMIGDMLKAYGNDACHFSEPLQLGETYEPEYSAEVCSQIRNATVLGTGFKTMILQQANNSQLLYEQCWKYGPNTPSFTALDIGTTGTATGYVMDPGKYYFHINGVDGANTYLSIFKNMRYDPFLIVESDNPTNEEVIVDTRLMNTLKPTGKYDTGNSNKIVYYTDVVGSEIIIDCIVSTYETYDNAGTPTDQYSAGHVCSIKFMLSTDGTTMSAATHILSQVYKVDDFPQFTLFMAGGAIMVNYASSFFYGKNVITAEEAWLTALHDGCKLSEFTIPMFKLLEGRK